jgi:NAD(P)-dependent dehydrogenase (short-subunit alcohol dehydrogenase family)
MRASYTARACEPEEVAATILWLGSTSPDYINGATIDINNGIYPR